MRHSIKRVSKSALSVILALMMVVSTMVVGMVTVNATITGISKIYFTPDSGWAGGDSDGNATFKLNYQKSDNTWGKSDFTLVSGTTNVYVATLDSSTTYYVLQFLRFNTAGTKEWNYSNQFSTIPSGKNYFTKTKTDARSGWDVSSTTNGTWSTYNVQTSCTVNYGVGTGMVTYGSVSATVTSDSQVDYNTSVTFTATENDGYSFGGWYSTPDCSGAAVSTSKQYTTNITEDTTLYAKFSQTSYVYLKNEKQDASGNRWTDPYAYFLDSNSNQVGNSWRGYSMDLVDGTNNIYRVAVPSGATKVIFNGKLNGSDKQYPSKNGIDISGDVFNNASNKWYNFDTTANYSIKGALVGGWDTTKTVDTNVNKYGVYSVDVELTNVDNGYFRVVYNSDSTEYGPYNTSTNPQNYDISSHNTANNSYEASTSYESKAFQLTQTGKYTIYVSNAYHENNRPDVWVVRTGDISEGTANFHGGDVLYLNTGAWHSGEAFFAVKCINGSTATWAKMTAVTGENGLYTVTLPGDSSTAYTDLMFGRMNKDYSSTAEADLKDDYVWNYQETTSVGYPADGQNCLKVNAANGENNWNNDATWTTYSTKTPVDTPEIEVDNSGVIADTADAYVTLTVKNYDTLNTKYTDGLDFVLYKNGAAVANLTSATYQIKEKGTYKVQAVPHNTTDYSESPFSNEVEVTKAGSGYEYSIIIQDDTIAMTPSATESNVLYSTTTLGNGYWFKIARTKDGTTEYSNSKAGNSQAKDINAGANVTIDDWSADATSYNNAYKQNGGAAYYIKFNTATGEISLSSTTDGKVSINVYAKDGTTIDGGTKQLGETSVTAGASQILAKEDYIVYSAQADSYLTIQTKMDSTAVTNGFYVYGFCINGVYYKAEAKINDIYETSYQVTGNEKNGIVEITPVYYNKNIEEVNEYITVYADASQLGDHWGNTISCYSYYYKSTSGTDAFETTPYPGQPMLLGTNGLYYTRVPRYYYSNGQKILDSNNNPYTISGVTLNSFTEKETHGTLYPEIGKNYQTYDYDDFKYIADLGYDTVKFVVQYRDDAESYQSKLLSGDKYAKNMSGSTLNINDYNSTNGGWNDLLNYDDEQIDLIGNVLTADQKSNSPLYVVSVGNQKTSMGEYSTVWYVYDSQGQYVTQGIPSDFIERKDTANNKDNYNVINSNSDYKNHPVKITYESEMNASTSVNTSNSGVRIDGRWLYTKSTAQQIPVNLTVQYYDGTNWVTDTTATAGTAKIDDISTENGVATKTFTERNVNAAISATAKSGYVFVEWGTVDENGTYTKLSNIKSASAEFMVDKSYNIVARFEKVEDGSLTISHEKYAGPDALGGGGYYKISADVVDASDSVITNYPTSESPITISNLADLKNSGYKIKITLTTTMKGDNEFADWYMLTPDGDYANITQSADVWGKKGEVSQTITVDVVDLYDENGANIVVSTLQYYSDIAPVTKNAVLYYKYLNRFGEERTYTKVVELTEKYNYQITDDLIYDNAPAVEDLHKNCTWTITEKTVSRQGTTATLWGTHSELMHTVSYRTSDSVTFAHKEVKDNEYLLDSSDEFFVADAKNDDNTNFAYWIVYDLNEHKKGNNKEIAKCYSTKFNLRILGDYYIYPVYSNEKSQSLTISDPTFTREQYTDSTGNIKSDYLYADFIVAYMSSNGILLNGDLAKDKYHTGLIVEFSNDHKIDKPDAVDAKLTADEFSALKAAYTVDESFSTSEIKSFATSGSKSGSVYVNDSMSKAMYKFDIKNEDYNNKNRLDYYVKFPNTAYYRHYVYKAYYYVYYTNYNGEVVYDMTEPVYFTLFDIGNSSAVTTKTTE